MELKPVSPHQVASHHTFDLIFSGTGLGANTREPNHNIRHLGSLLRVHGPRCIDAAARLPRP
jgi:hypothetical protein